MKKNNRRRIAVFVACMLLCLSLGTVAMADYKEDLTINFVVTEDMIPKPTPTATPWPSATPYVPVITPPVTTPTIYRPIVRTGDETPIAAIAITAAGSLLAALSIYIYIRKKEDKENG